MHPFTSPEKNTYLTYDFKDLSIPNDNTGSTGRDTRVVYHSISSSRH